MMLPARKPTVVFACFLASCLVLLFTARTGSLFTLGGPYHHRSPYQSQHAPQATCEDTPRTPVDPDCDGFPDTSNVLLVMKTGESEAFARVPTQLLTVLKCLPDSLIFSDMEQNIAGRQIHDSLSTVLPEVQEGNPDFDLYRRQKWCLVDQESCNKLGNPSREGWNLDKYKNIHIAEKTYAMRPGYDWYLFVDADTYVVWPNLMQWLGQLDPTKKLYLGSVSLINDFMFGHGGSGYIVSGAAMEAFVGKNPGVGNEYDARTAEECCGDYVFAKAMKSKADIGVQQMWPTINGEKPSTLPFGPSHWCHPIVTMHHMNSEEINAFWQFDRKRHLAQLNKSDSSRPLVLRDIFDEFVSPHLQATREDWDNLADDRFYLDTSGDRDWDSWRLGRMKDPAQYNELEKRAHRSFEDCGAACRSLGPDECFAYRYHDGACSMSRSFRLGRPVKRQPDEEMRTMSGWDVDKIRAWIQQQDDCDSIRWPEVKT